jgi:hypothetical protein
MRPVGNQPGRASVCPLRDADGGLFVACELKGSGSFIGFEEGLAHLTGRGDLFQLAAPGDPPKRLNRRSAMSRLAAQSIDLAYRPTTYFWPHGLKPPAIKGANRRALVASVLANDPSAEIPPVLLQHALPAPVRSHLGSQHPWDMGGEYLPDLVSDEVEIARITIASTTQDVTSVYARQDRDRILVRVVDEYDGATLARRKERSASQPLSLGQLVQFFLRVWNLCAVLRMNFEEHGYPEGQVFGFFEGSSGFYPQFDDLLRRRVRAFLRKTKGAQFVAGNDREE